MHKKCLASEDRQTANSYITYNSSDATKVKYTTI